MSCKYWSGYHSPKKLTVSDIQGGKIVLTLNKSSVLKDKSISTSERGWYNLPFP